LSSQQARRAKTYDQFATAYSADYEANAFNVLYERPAMLELLGNLQGKRVLDVGCGAGALAKATRERERA
jgi:ubiquinone/menaquinone biosynthesis C-methylase UbiE